MHPIESFRRVVKIGGSLFDLVDLNRRILDWHSEQRPGTTIWVVGGGCRVNALRQIATDDLQVNERQHWESIQIMEENAHEFSRSFPDWDTSDLSHADALRTLPVNTILLPVAWTRQHASDLPKSWDVTSDSIAAKLARWSGARELVLLKSDSPPTTGGAPAAVTHSYVDAHFLRAIAPEPSQINAPLGIRLINLRSDPFTETHWRC